jgi:hypothetical protein
VNPTGRYIIPEFRERSANGERVHNPYTKLFEERIIFLGVQIDDASADDVMAQLLCLESMDPDRDIQIYINSPGGSYTAMTAIYDTIQFVKSAEVRRYRGSTLADNIKGALIVYENLNDRFSADGSSPVTGGGTGRVSATISPKPSALSAAKAGSTSDASAGSSGVKPESPSK